MVKHVIFQNKSHFYKPGWCPVLFWKIVGHWRTLRLKYHFVITCVLLFLCCKPNALCISNSSDISKLSSSKNCGDRLWNW